MEGLLFKYEGYRFFLEGDGDYEFNDCRHLYGFLNYLYRTDAAQKWTNEKTRMNAGFLFPETIETLKHGKKEEASKTSGTGSFCMTSHSAISNATMTPRT